MCTHTTYCIMSMFSFCGEWVHVTGRFPRTFPIIYNNTYPIAAKTHGTSYRIIALFSSRSGIVNECLCQELP